MFYCPKCQQTYDEGMQRFCSNDGGRLLPAPSSGKSVNQSNGVFTNLLGRVVPGNEKDEKLSSIPRFVQVEPTKPAQSNFRPPTENNIFKIDRELKPETEVKPQTQKPLPRIIKPGEIPASQARLGDRKTNPTGRLAITWENPDVLLGQTVKGRYQVIKKFEQDETSIAYLAEDEIVPNKKVVVRVLMDEDEADNFTNKIFAEERVSLSLINHPNIARILDSGELLEGKPFIVSEFTEGESVKEMLRKTGQFNALRTSRIISQAADALSAAHQNGVLHRNLKPENIVLTISEAGNEQVKLINFGISKDNLNKENIVYKSPEQLADKRVLVIGGGNSACDIASEAARVGKSCHLSLRRGYWFLPKTLFGKPTAESFMRYFPVAIQRFFIKAALRVVLGKYEDYGLPKPDHKIFQKHPTLNSELLHYLKHGRIKPRPDVKKFEGKTVHFVDGASDIFDAVVCGTGFYVSFPFLPEGVVKVKNGNLAMVYAGCVLENYKNLYILGTTQPRYGFGPLVTPASQMLAQIIKLQDEMVLPIGLVMKQSGVKLPDSHLVDPISALRHMKIAKYTLPMLLKKEKKLRKKFAGKASPTENLMFQPNSDMKVY